MMNIKDWQKQELERKNAEIERKKRLLGVSEPESYSLPIDERYDRIRYIREREGMEKYEENKRRLLPVEPKKEKTVINLPPRDWSKQYD